MRILLFLGFLSVSFLTIGQHHSHTLGRKISFPDVPGYKTITTDFHIHSVFSDGTVWPTVRVAEALLDGLDAISLTEHLEYQPHKADIPHPDRNRAYAIALDHAKDHDLMIIPGSEITRRMPPGHSNAIFIKDANALLKDDSVEVFNEAKKQGAFIFWNHPNWISQRSDGIATLTELHQQLIKDGKLHGIEVVNEMTYSDEALQIALDNNLTIMGTSDIHGLIDWQFEVPRGGHRDPGRPDGDRPGRGAAGHRPAGRRGRGVLGDRARRGAADPAVPDGTRRGDPAAGRRLRRPRGWRGCRR